MIQLDLFDDNVLETILREIKKVKDSGDHVRKSLFARINELERLYLELAKEKEAG